MTRGRKLGLRRRIGVAASALVVLGFVFIDHGPAWAQMEPGTAQCLVLSGTIRFDPPLTNSGGAPDALTGGFRLTQCTAESGPTPIRALAGVHANVENSCAGILPVTGFQDTGFRTTIWWGLRTISPTTVEFAGVSAIPSKDLELVIGGSTTTASGSYSGPDEGASSTATINTADTVEQIMKACSSAQGLSKVNVVGGRLHVG